MLIKQGTGEVIRDEDSQNEMTQDLASAAAKHREEQEPDQVDDDNASD